MELSLAVRLDRDPHTRELPGWYLDQDHIDYGYALAGHKAQGVTTGRTFTVVAGATDREWAYVAIQAVAATPTPSTSPSPKLETTSADIDTLGAPPPSSDIAERVAWIVAQRKAEHNQHERSTHGIDLAAGR